MDDLSVKTWSARLPIRVQSIVGVLVLATSVLAVFGLFFSAATLLLSAVTVPGVLLGVLGVLGAKLLVSFLAGMVRRIYEDGVVDPSAMFRAVDRMVAPGLAREAVDHATASRAATAGVSMTQKTSPASTLSRASTPPAAPTAASRVRELTATRAVTETEQRVA